MKKEELHSYNWRRLKAEEILCALYPDTNDITARNKGSFYRRYSPDLMEFDEASGEALLSRDGLLQTLPQEFLSTSGELRSDFKEGYEQQQARLRVLEDAFMPIDTFFIRQYVKAQREANAVLSEKTALILKQYFDYDINAEPNPYIKRLAVLLPFAKILRGQPGLVRELLETVFDGKVTHKTYPYSADDTLRGFIPKTMFTLHCPGLTSGQYAALSAAVRETEQFIRYWFMPFDHQTEIEIRDTEPGNDILDYNTLIG